MKKSLSFLTILALSLSIAQADTKSNIEKLLQTQANQKVSVLKIEPLKSNSDYNIAIVETLDTKYRIPVFTTKDGNIIIGLSNVFFSLNAEDEKTVNDIYETTKNYNDNLALSAKLNPLFESIPADSIVDLSSTTKDNKKILYIVSDPMCPHCQEELKHIDERLKDANVRMIPVGMLGQKSAEKSAYILEHIKSAKTLKDKIALLNKVYNPSFVPGNVDSKDIRKVQATTSKIFDSGLIKGTPFLYNYIK